MTKAFKFFLGLFVVVFIALFVCTIIIYFSNGEVPAALCWSDLISFGLAIVCIPAITLSEARRDNKSAKRWTQEHNGKHVQWKNDKEKREL